MPQRKELTWKQLRVGVMVGAALLILMAAIFFVSGQIGPLTGHYTLRAYFPEASGLRDGAQVQVSGVPAGNVTRVELSPYHQPNRAVEVVVSISKKFQDNIRADSVARVQTAGLLGEAFIDISRGSPDQPMVQGGGELKTEGTADIRAVVRNANDVLSNLTLLSAKLNDIGNQITAGKGTIGKFIYDPTLYNKLDRTVSAFQGLTNQIQSGRGTVGKLLSSDALYNKLDSTVDRANQIMDQIQHGHGTVAKLINDPALYNNLDATVTQAHTLLANINGGQGTLGKLAKDPRLYDRVNSVAGNVNTVTQRMASGQGSLGLLSTNTKLYDNLSASATSLREFLDEFRKNPRQYLTLHLRIF